MAWEAILKSVNVVQGEAVVVITFKNKGRVFDKTYRIGSPGDDFIRKQSAQEIRNLEALDTFADAAIPGPVDITIATPSADEIAAAEFFAKRAKLRNLRDAISAGLSKDDPTALEAEVKALFKPEYVDHPAWKVG